MFSNWDVNNLYCWVMSQKLSLTTFEWFEDTFQLNEDFIKNSNEESDKEYFSKLIFSILRNYMKLK